ncbi:MAG: hypothetical protein ABIH80_06360 [Methanobacteriota archaeon]
MMIFAALLCGLLLFLVTTAFLFSEKFRNDVVVGEGEANVLGILNAKGAIIVVVLAMFIGGTLYASGKSALTIDKLGKVVPEEAPLLTKTMNDEIESLQEAHLKLAKAYYSGKRKEVQQFLEKEWLPKFSDNIASNKKVREELARALASGKPDINLSKVLSEMNTAQQQTLLAKGRDLVAPIDKLETETLQNISQNYARLLKSNETVNDLLESLK